MALTHGNALGNESIAAFDGSGMDGDQIGWLVHTPGGARWVFDYDASRSDDDESGYRFGGHAFRPGEYVSIAYDADLHTFKVMSESRQHEVSLAFERKRVPS